MMICDFEKCILMIGLCVLFFSSLVQAYTTNQSGELAVGQPNLISYNVNNVIGPNANTLYSPNSVYSDGVRLFIADSRNNRVLIYNSIPVNNYATADVVIGQPDMVSNSANNGGLSAKSLNFPKGVFSDGTHLFVSDCNNNRVLIYNTIPSSNYVSANIVIGQPDMMSNSSNNGGLSANSLFQPNSIYCNGIQLFITDAANNRVLKYNTIPTSNDAPANIVIGQPNMMSNALNNGGRNANTLYYPHGIYGNGNRLFIADTFNARVLIYNTIPTTNNTSANIVVGQPDMTNISGLLNANTLNGPTGLYCDGNRLFVADENQNRILIYNTIPIVNNPTADLVIGQPNMTSSSFGSRDAMSLYAPMGICFDGIRLFTADSNNNRIIIYYPYPLSFISPNYGMVGKTIQVISSGFYGTPISKFSRSGNPDITSINSTKCNDYSYLYTFDLTNAVPNFYNVTMTANTNPRSLKNAFTILSPLQIPIGWKIIDLGQAGMQTSITNPCGLDIGDADQDNFQELFVANQVKTVYMFKQNAQIWTCSALTVQSGENLGQVLLADGNGDGAWEVYGASSSNTHPYQFQLSSSWQKTDLGAGYASATQIRSLVKADLDHDGVVEIYAAETDGGNNSNLSQFKYTGSGWSETDIPGCPSNPAYMLAAGDGDNSTYIKLYSANEDGNIYQYSLNGNSWQISVVGTGTDIMYGVAVGDGDNDGKNEIYAANKNGLIYQYRWSGSSWAAQSIGQVNGNTLYAVAVSDGENSGTNQVYAICGNGHVYEFKNQSGNWSMTDLGNANTPLYAMAIGDADNDHHFEIYTLGQNNHVYQFKASTQGTLTPTPIANIFSISATPTTTPTFSVVPSQNFFKIYHNQINPYHGEQAKITWTQSQAGSVNITIYNLLGEKINVLLDNQTYQSGIYNEIIWNGRNGNGGMVGSGIYIVVFEVAGRKEIGKVAVIK
jgi:hypothetical protein